MTSPSHKPHAPAPAEAERESLKTQARWGRLAFTIIGPGAVFYMRVIRGNRIEGVENARRVYRDAIASGRPLLVCPNHLTMFDSIFLHHAFAKITEYLADWRLFSWNVPAIENFKQNPFLRAVTYLGKTIPIDRSGDARHHKSVLDKIKYLVASGEVCTIFAEGGRSRSGRVEPANVTSGVGHILKDLENPQVLCVYLRGAHQESFSFLPRRGDTLHLYVELLEPTTHARGLRASRELSRQVIEKLKEMEDAHFAGAARGGAKTGSNGASPSGGAHGVEAQSPASA